MAVGSANQTRTWWRHKVGTKTAQYNASTPARTALGTSAPAWTHPQAQHASLLVHAYSCRLHAVLQPSAAQHSSKLLVSAAHLLGYAGGEALHASLLILNTLRFSCCRLSVLTNAALTECLTAHLLGHAGSQAPHTSLLVLGTLRLACGRVHVRAHDAVCCQLGVPQVLRALPAGHGTQFKAVILQVVYTASAEFSGLSLSVWAPCRVRSPLCSILWQGKVDTLALCQRWIFDVDSGPVQEQAAPAESVGHPCCF